MNNNPFFIFRIGPALLAVVIIGGIAISGVVLYQAMLEDEEYQSNFHVRIPADYYITRSTAHNGLPALATSSSLESLRHDIAYDTSSYLDFSLLDEINDSLVEKKEIQDLKPDF